MHHNECYTRFVGFLFKTDTNFLLVVHIFLNLHFRNMDSKFIKFK